MKTLARRIAIDLRTSKVSAIYNSELARVFPKTMPTEEREESIRRFASDHGLEVDIFEVGLCAIFGKSRSKNSKESGKRKLPKALVRSRRGSHRKCG